MSVPVKDLKPNLRLTVIQAKTLLLLIEQIKKELQFPIAPEEFEVSKNEYLKEKASPILVESFFFDQVFQEFKTLFLQMDTENQKEFLEESATGFKLLYYIVISGNIKIKLIKLERETHLDIFSDDEFEEFETALKTSFGHLLAAGEFLYKTYGSDIIDFNIRPFLHF